MARQNGHFLSVTSRLETRDKQNSMQSNFKKWFQQDEQEVSITVLEGGCSKKLRLAALLAQNKKDIHHITDNGGWNKVFEQNWIISTSRSRLKY